MFKLNDSEILFIGLVLEGFFYGLYSGIFAMYLRIRASKKDTNKMHNIISYSICALYILSVTVFVCDITVPIYLFVSKPVDSLLRVALIQMTAFGCCDFIAQFILIYRCWIVWNRNIRIVIVPSILAFAFLVIWLVGGSSTYISSGRLVTPAWGQYMLIPSLVTSLTVNALVTGLIVFRIFKIFQEVKATSDGQLLGATGGSKLRHIIFVLIESGMALCSIHLARLVATILGLHIPVGIALSIIGSIHDMLNGITPTIILVRTTMGLSFHDEKSMEEVAIESLRFAPNHLNLVPGTGSIISNVGQENGDDYIDIQGSNDIDVVER